MTFVVFFELKVMRRKSMELRAASQKKDEAFNAVLTTRSVMNTVRDRGGDIGGAPSLLDRAKDAMRRGNYDSCIDLCEKARSEMTRPSPASELPLGEEDVDAKGRLEAMAENIVSTRAARADVDSYKGTKLEGPSGGNYLGAKFEISQAKAEMGRAARSGTDTSVASGLIVEAETAYTAGNYDKALSLAVRSRKALSSSAEAETIPLREQDEEKEAIAQPDVPRVRREKARAQAEKPCRSCGAVLEKGDAFCPICGTRVAPTACPQCGAKPRPGDKFCRKCGSGVE